VEKTYELGTTTYVQRPLVLGQIRQLLEQLEGLTFDAAAGPAVLVATLGDRLPLCLAVVLTPEGASPREKDLVALADEIEFAIAPEQVLEVVEDFFDCNPLASLLERAAGMLRSLTARVGVEVKPAATAGAPGSTTSSSSSPAATSPGETGSSGASPSPSASPGSSTGAET
jgi:hypothetical protein